MPSQIRVWFTAHPRWTIALLVGAMLGPFLAKPFNLDDPLFIWLARQIQAHPGDPLGFAVNWYGKVWPMWAVTENPPLAGYFYAAAGSILGWSEIALHFAGAMVALVAALGTHRLASRLCRQPLAATCAALFTPLFLVSANTVMCDMLMLAFWIWAVIFWVEGVEQDQSAKIVLAGLLVALALLTKYFGAALIPLLAAHGAMTKRRLGAWAAGLLIPLAALAAYQWVTRQLYGHALFSAAAGFASSVQGELGFSKLAGGIIALAFTGGGVASALFLAPSLWRPRTLAAIAGGALALGGALICTGLFPHKYPILAIAAPRMAIYAQWLLWETGGALALALAVVDISRNLRDARSWLLALWVAGTFCFAAFLNWTVNGRSLLPLLPALGILAARRWEAGGLRHPRAFQIGLTASALLALAVAQSDYQLAIAVRHSAQTACAKYRQDNSTVWFEGHWGFQYYMEQAGAAAVDFKHNRQLPGDILVVPQHNTDVSAPAAEVVRRSEILSVPGSFALSDWQGDVGAGFYSSAVGPLPFGFGRVPPEILYVFELKDPGAK